MSALTSLARARAFETGRAVPIATRRHVYVSDRPLVFVPLSLAGEANAPLACLVGSTVESPTLLVVPQPRNRDLRFAFAATLASVVLDYVHSFTVSMELLQNKSVFAGAPQLLVANPSGVAFTRLLGRSTRLRRTTGEYAVHASVPLLGRWLTYFAERTEHPGSSAMLSMTAALSAHWASGQSALEDANLAALMGWIAPWDGLSGPEAALQAEDPVRWPPAGPATDPSFDNEVLAPLIRSYDAATSSSDEAPQRRAIVALESALREQMEPTWRLMWQAVSLLRSLPPGPSVSARWADDRREFTERMEYWRDGGLPQGRLDQAVAAARRLNTLEREQDAYTVDRAFDDELAMAEFRVSGEAFAGTVVQRDPTRLDTSGPRRKLRPYVTLRTADPVRLEPGAVVRSAARSSQDARIASVSPAGASVEVTLELLNGMGRSLTPAEGSVPELSESLCYSSLRKDGGLWPTFPRREETPWTHGGPPAEYVPTDDDAGEAWV
jgi:hypothetical protein